MNLEAWDPLRRYEEFRVRSEQMWREFMANWPAPELQGASIGFMPEVDLVETPVDFRIYLSLPGMLEDDIVIEVENRHVIVRGERHAPYDQQFRDLKRRDSDNRDVQRRDKQFQEWRYGYFERRFEFSSEISATDLRATYDAGVLTIVAVKLIPDREGQS